MKRITACLATTLFLCCFSASTAQEDNESVDMERKEASRFQVETGLVEVRAIVTDKDGRIVEGLQKDDFVLTENDEPQEISHFSVSKIESRLERTAAKSEEPQDESARLMQARERLNQPPVRTILLYVDTLHLSFETLNDVKRALHRFIDEQLTDQDFVAFTTSATLGVAQQFTRDRKILRYAVEQMRYSPSNRDTLFTPLLAAQFINDNPEGIRFGIDIMRLEHRFVCPCTRLRNLAYHKAMEVLGNASFSRETTFAIIENFLDQMQDLPGKRMAVIFSDGFTLNDRIGSQQFDAIHKVVSHAVRSGTVIYTIDAKGLQAPLSIDVTLPSGIVDPTFESLVQCLRGCESLESEQDREECQEGCIRQFPVPLECLEDADTFDEFVCQPPNPGDLDAYLNASAIEQTNGLYSLATESGGKLYENMNDMNAALGQVLEDNRFYYVLSYYTNEEKDPKQFNDLKVKVPAHPEYKVIFPRGFWMPAVDEEAEAKTPQELLVRAMRRPLPVTDLGVSVRADYVETEDDTKQVSLGVYFEGDRFQYREQDLGNKVELEIMSLIYDSSGERVDGISAQVTGNLTSEGVEQAKANGYRFSRRLALGPGVYQARIGVREEGTNRIGTATTWIEIPEVTPDKLEMSSLVLSNPLDLGFLDEEGIDLSDLEQIKMVQGIPMYAPDDIFYYSYRVHRSNLSEAGSGLSIMRELLQAGEPVKTEDWQPLSMEYKEADSKGWLDFDGELDISDLAPGVYELKISVREEALRTVVRRSIVFGIL